MPSRDPKDLHPELQKRWEYMQREWKRLYPTAPQPFLTCTYRPASEQAELVRRGASRAGPMRSLHNYVPALAFDVAFDPDPTDGVGNDLTWTFHWYEAWGTLAESIGLEWGGRWPSLVDGPHVQWPTDWELVQAGGPLPELKPLPNETEDEGLLPDVRSLFVHKPDGSIDLIELDVLRPARVKGWKLMVNARK